MQVAMMGDALHHLIQALEKKLFLVLGGGARGQGGSMGERCSRVPAGRARAYRRKSAASAQAESARLAFAQCSVSGRVVVFTRTTADRLS